jgi:uncharacterized protein YxjI
VLGLSGCSGSDLLQLKLQLNQVLDRQKVDVADADLCETEQ